MTQINLYTSNSPKGLTKIIVVRLSSSIAVVIEGQKDGLLVYKVDASVPSGQGPITIIPKLTPLTSAPLSPDIPDWIRYSDATLKRGDSIVYRNMLIRSMDTETQNYVVSLYIGSDAAQRQQEIEKATVSTPPISSVPSPLSSQKDSNNTKKKSSKIKEVYCISGKSSIKIKITLQCPRGYKRVEFN